MDTVELSKVLCADFVCTIDKDNWQLSNKELADAYVAAVTHGVAKLRHQLELILNYATDQCDDEELTGIRHMGVCSILIGAEVYLRQQINGNVNHRTLSILINQFHSMLRGYWLSSGRSPNYPIHIHVCEPSEEYNRFAKAVEYGVHWPYIKEYAAARIALIDELADVQKRFQDDWNE